MKKFIAFMAILALVSCGKSGDKGELVGVQGGKHPEKPYGMTLVPGGALLWVNLMMMLLHKTPN
jgi:hypothetical protein